MKNKHRRNKKINQLPVYEQMTIQEFESYCAIIIDQMITNDRYSPGIEKFGAQTFGTIGLRDEGFGIIARCRDGSSFILNIKPLDELGK